jgi:hypothetical protein
MVRFATRGAPDQVRQPDASKQFEEAAHLGLELEGRDALGVQESR